MVICYLLWLFKTQIWMSYYVFNIVFNLQNIWFKFELSLYNNNKKKKVFTEKKIYNKLISVTTSTIKIKLDYIRLKKKKIINILSIIIRKKYVYYLLYISKIYS